MKKRLLILVLMSLGNVMAHDDWQMWLTQNANVKFNKDIKGLVGIENRLKNDLGDHFYIHGDAMAFHRIFKENYLGLQFRQIFEQKSSDHWASETRPALIWTNKFTLSGAHFSTRVKGMYRVLENKANRFALRARVGLDFLRIKPIALFVTEEIFYHYNKLNRFDRNRLAVGLKVKAKVGKVGLDFKAFYLRQENKSSKTKPWAGTNVLGASLTAKF